MEPSPGELAVMLEGAHALNTLSGDGEALSELCSPDCIETDQLPTTHLTPDRPLSAQTLQSSSDAFESHRLDLIGSR